MTFLSNKPLFLGGVLLLVRASSGFHSTVSVSSFSASHRRPVSMASTPASSSSFSTSTAVPSWSDLQAQSEQTVTGQAMKNEVQLRQMGKGSAHVQNTLRLFDHDQQQSQPPRITLFRDHAGWCPYCQKTMLLIEEKQIPIQIELVPMRSYGDKPREFLQKVPSGLLPAIEVDGRVITESQVIMELLDQWHPPSEGYKAMLPSSDDTAGWAKYNQLARLERELFSWWCTLVFRPEGPLSLATTGNKVLDMITGKKTESAMSGSMKGFLDCIGKVDAALTSTKGPWFFGEFDYPTMIDFIYVSHVERMLASCAYWKGLNLRDPKWNLPGLNAWLNAFEKREAYLAFKSDYYTHIKDIPPQYGPGYDGGFEQDRPSFSAMILGRDGSWTLPLSHDDALQPLYRGPPLPLCILDAMNLSSDANGSFESSDPVVMAEACRHMAAWKLAGNGIKVSRFAARGGPKGARNPRKTFGAQLADPYADPDDEARPYVDSALRVVCAALLAESPDSCKDALLAAVPKNQISAVQGSMAYLRDRVGVPRDLPLAAARYLRAYLNWGIDVLTE